MIKVTVVDNPPIEEKQFPKLMVSTVDKRIVFFSESKKGIVLLQGDSDKRTGFYADYWVMDHFVDYNEQLTLQNI